MTSSRVRSSIAFVRATPPQILLARRISKYSLINAGQTIRPWTRRAPPARRRALGLYPLLLAWTAGCVAYGLTHPDALTLVLAVKAGVMVAVLLMLEWLVPYERCWGMTWRHLWRRDLPFIAMNGIALGLINVGLTALAVEVAAEPGGHLGGWPLWLQVVLGLSAFEALQYWTHRWMHFGRGRVGNFLWRTHAIHHLPQQLYVVMHAVFHPFNGIIVRLAVQLLPLWLLGYGPEAAFVIGSIIALHGTVSHLNLDMRAGWLNYVFVGPELHRYHHSAEGQNATNLANTLSLFDWIFGAFEYHPGIPPRELGLREADGYPGQHAPLQSVLFPLSLQPVAPVRVSSMTTTAGDGEVPGDDRRIREVESRRVTRAPIHVALVLAACGTPTPPGLSSGPGITSVSETTASSSTGSDGSSTGPEDDSAGSAGSTPGASTGILRDVGAATDFDPTQPEGCKGKVDLLFLISRSGNMKYVQDQFLVSLPGFVQTIEDRLEAAVSTTARRAARPRAPRSTR